MAVIGSEFGLRDLVGLRGASRWVFLAILEGTIALYMVNITGWAGLGALLLLLMAGALVLLSQDPLPWPVTGFVGVAAPVATALTTLYRPDSGSDQVWAAFASSYVLAVLVLRGRVAAAWVAVWWVAVVVGLLGVSGGLSSAVITSSVVPVATVAGVSVCAVIMRPVQRSLAVLHEEAAMYAAAQGALSAATAERDRQLAHVDRLAGPILERIADGGALTAADREKCRLLEAELRDGLRAPQLVTAQLSSAARGARSREVEVLLLDDGGFVEVAAGVRQRVVDAAVRELDAARACSSVTVRVLPPGRRVLATVLTSGTDQDRRVEIDPAGQVRVCP